VPGDTLSDVALLYRRAGFGLRPAELEQTAAGGYDAAVENLLAGLGNAPDPGAAGLAPPVFTAGPPPRGAGAGTAERAAFAKAARRDLAGLQRWWMDRMIATSTPLREKLTLFWHGHFATGVSKVRDPRLMYMQNQLFRSAGAGSFEALTQAVAKDGAMMIWLDTSTDKKAHPNENFAREMMELFTLGIGNYTQDDVTAAARGFTGWTYDRSRYQYVFRPAQHDYGSKTYLGATGDWNGEDIIHIAVSRPESARFVLAALWSHFAYPVAPSDPVVSDLLSGYGGSLSVAGALRSVFLHPAFRSAQSRTGLLKQPAEYLAGSARALGLDASLASSTAGAQQTGAGRRSTLDLPALAGALGQTLFNPPNVGGWGQNGYWLSTATAHVRMQSAMLLARQADLSGLSSLPVSQRVGAAANLLGLVDGWGPTTAAALSRVAADPAALLALALVSPEHVLA
jgi:uncharacterized protein (DUF1800 family)